MKLSLSTNWCNRRIESGEEIVDLALELGFGELELGFHTTAEQAKGFSRRIDEMPVGSIHAFCPVPISAPCGYPELYQLASFDEEQRKMAALQIGRNVRFASEMGADTVVLHAGRVLAPRPFEWWRKRTRRRRGEKMLQVFRKELAAIVPVLESAQVTLALENLPYFEGFPDEVEMSALLEEFRGAPVKAWFDTGHHRVRVMNGWVEGGSHLPPLADESYAGMHLNDVKDVNDDHFAPGFGKVDFASLGGLAHKVRHVVFEPNDGVGKLALKKGIEHIRQVMVR